MRHAAGKEKFKLWNLAPKRSVLILGASNLSRMPRVENKELEVHSYPSASLVQACTIVKHRTTVFQKARQVILAFGLNDQAQSNRIALKKNMERLIEAAVGAFPNAVIHVPLINFGPALPEEQISNLKALN